ncbi:hypothetical protein BaRGS_00010962, partial [Batillaria attramentaria]
NVKSSRTFHNVGPSINCKRKACPPLSWKTSRSLLAGTTAMKERKLTNSPTTSDARKEKKMEAEWKKRLRENLTYLVENLDPIDVMDDMFSSGVFTANEKDSIIGEGSTVRTERVRRFLDCLQLKDEKAYPAFLLALKKTGQNHIATMLESMPTRGPELPNT